MLWTHQIEIDAEPGNEAVDATFGQPLAIRTDPVYRGMGRVMSNEARLVYLSNGDAKLRADFFVYLPPGEHGIRVNMVFRWGTVTGRVRKVSFDTSQFYTQLEVSLEGV